MSIYNNAERPILSLTRVLRQQNFILFLTSSRTGLKGNSDAPQQINARNIFHSFPSQNPRMIKCVQEKDSSPCAHYDGVWGRTNVVPLILNLGTKRGESTTSPGKQPHTERIQAIWWHEIQLRATLTLPREPWEAVALEKKSLDLSLIWTVPI